MVDVIHVWKPLWPVFDLFRSCERVWRYPALGGPPIGLDWTQVRALAEGLRVPWEPDTVRLLQAMETEAANIWTAEWKRKNPPTKGR